MDRLLRGALEQVSLWGFKTKIKWNRISSMVEDGENVGDNERKSFLVQGFTVFKIYIFKANMISFCPTLPPPPPPKKTADEDGGGGREIKEYDF